MTDVLVISGPAGVGKSSVAFELSLQLQAEGIDHALIDTDELDRIYPVPDDLSRLTEESLTSMWQAFAARGARRLILVGVHADRASEREWIARAVPGAIFTVVRLVASEQTLLERVARREIGSGANAQADRTRAQLAAVRSDGTRDIQTIATDRRAVVDVARELRLLWPRVDVA